MFTRKHPGCPLAPSLAGPKKRSAGRAGASCEAVNCPAGPLRPAGRRQPLRVGAECPTTRAIPLDATARRVRLQDDRGTIDRLVRVVAVPDGDSVPGDLDTGHVLAGDSAGIGKPGFSVVRRELAAVLPELR